MEKGDGPKKTFDDKEATKMLPARAYAIFLLSNVFSKIFLFLRKEFPFSAIFCVPFTADRKINGMLGEK